MAPEKESEEEDRMRTLGGYIASIKMPRIGWRERMKDQTGRLGPENQ